MWHAVAEYADGTAVDAYFPYAEGGVASRENQRQYELECYLIERDGECVFYSVTYEEM